MYNPTLRSYMNRPSKPAPQPSIARKVVSIPVHFVGSDTRSHSESALGIQKIFRGFLVRKSMKEIILIRREVDEVERGILSSLESIRGDKKERLRVNETLMGLLFKLDSVLGVGPGVRDCRKAVIRKAIALQEIIDGAEQKTEIRGAGEFGTQHYANNSVNGTNQDAGTGDHLEAKNEQSVSEKAAQNFRADVADCALKVEGFSEFGTEHYANDSMNIEEMINEPEMANKQNLWEETAHNFGPDAADQALEIEVKTIGTGVVCHNKGAENFDDSRPEFSCDNFVNSEADEDEEDYCIVKKVVAGETYSANPMADPVEEDNSIDETTLKAQEYETETTKGVDLKDQDHRERIMEENAKMMSMMKQLSEQNRAQMHMLTSLSRRVEQLEKAFVCDRLRKKMKDKKKRASNGLTNVLDCCTNQKKCGKN